MDIKSIIFGLLIGIIAASLIWAVARSSTSDEQMLT